MEGNLYHGSRRHGPIVSVIVPAHNAAATLDDQLAALAGQDFDGPWEVVVVDHESTDGTGDLARRWQAVMPHVRVLPTRAPRGVAHPRNVGAGAAAGNRILICDADDIVAPDWVSQLVDGLRTYDVVTGPLDRALLNDPEHHAWMAPEPAPVDGRPPPDYGYLPYPSGGNMGVRRPVLEALRGFDPSVSGKEDIDFGWRAIEAGYTIGFVPGAVIHYRMRGDLFGAARQRFYRAQAEPLLYRRYRRAGMQREPLSDVWGAYRHLLHEVPRVIRSKSRSRRYRFAYQVGGRAGRLVGSARHRTLFL